MKTIISIISCFILMASFCQADDTIKVAAAFAKTGKASKTGSDFSTLLYLIDFLFDL